MQSRWVPLRPKDSICIVAPAGRTKEAWTDLESACQLIEAAGFRATFDDTIFSDAIEPFPPFEFANSDEARYQSFVRALNGESRVLWCFRGGYGSDRVAARLQRDGVIPTEPKLLVGFSDITVLHHFCRVKWQWPVLHAPGLNQLVKNKIAKEDVKQLWQWLRGDITRVSLPLEPMNEAARQSGSIEAEINGGNLMVIQSAMATPWEMPRDGIVLFEEINEAPYRVARILQQWLSSGWLQQVKAVLFGDFMGEGISLDAMDNVLGEFARQFPQPVLRCRGIGHGENNHPLPFGVPARLSLGAAPVLTSGLARTSL